MNSTTLAAAAAAAVLLFLTSHLLSSPVAFGLSFDGMLLLSFKYATMDDPYGVLTNWNYNDHTPCSWNGVVCTAIGNATRVTALFLPSVSLVGSLPPVLGLVEHLRHIELSGNSLNGILPATLFNASELQVLSLAANAFSGELPDVANNALRVLNLSNNDLSGAIPGGFPGLRNLTTLSLSNNYLSGELPNGGFEHVEILDLSSNLLNGSLPEALGGDGLRYLNLSHNRIDGEIPAKLGSAIPAKATVDLSFNNLTGKVPDTGAFVSQKPDYFAGNPYLCVYKVPCSPPPPTSMPGPAPAPAPLPPIAAMPNVVIPMIPHVSTSPEAGANGTGGQQRKRSRLSPEAIVVIIVGDIAGIGLLFAVLLYVYKAQGKWKQQPEMVKAAATATLSVSSSSDSRELGLGPFSFCLANNCGYGDSCEDTSGRSSSSSEINGEEVKESVKPPASLVLLDGEMKLETEALLGASAYVLGVAGTSIVYKAVLDDGTALAVRRIGESTGIGRVKDFEREVRSIARLRHPNLLRLRGFYWAPDEKLLISDFAPNGSLANIAIANKLGSSPFHLSWAARLRTARGVARALAFLHDKGCVHGNLKPSNILFAADMEPLVADFGLDRLVGNGNKSGQTTTSAGHQLGGKRPLFSHTSFSVPEQCPGGPSASTLYQAPESMKDLRPSAKWDVFAFGMVVLELMAGRAFAEGEVAQWNAGFVEEGERVVRMADPAIRREVQGREEAMVGCLRLGFRCAAVDPGRRPAMREAVQVLERVIVAVNGYASN